MRLGTCRPGMLVLRLQQPISSFTCFANPHFWCRLPQMSRRSPRDSLTSHAVLPPPVALTSLLLTIQYALSRCSPPMVPHEALGRPRLLAVDMDGTLPQHTTPTVSFACHPCYQLAGSLVRCSCQHSADHMMLQMCTADAMQPAVTLLPRFSCKLAHLSLIRAAPLRRPGTQSCAGVYAVKVMSCTARYAAASMGLERLMPRCCSGIYSRKLAVTYTGCAAAPQLSHAKPLKQTLMHCCAGVQREDTGSQVHQLRSSRGQRPASGAGGPHDPHWGHDRGSTQPGALHHPGIHHGTVQALSESQGQAGLRDGRWGG